MSRLREESFPDCIYPIFILNLKRNFKKNLNELDELPRQISSPVRNISYVQNMEIIMLHEWPNLKPNLRNAPKSG